MKRFLNNYRERHLHPANLFLHVIGVPTSFVLPFVFLVTHREHPASWTLLAFVIGYVLQFVGHGIEGNDAGEMILIKRLLGRPYMAYGLQHPSRVAENSESA